MSQWSDRETTVPVESPSDTLCEDHSSTVLFLRGEQIKQLILTLKKDSEPCRVSRDLYINDTGIRRGSYINRILSYDCSYACYSAIVDLLYILRFHSVIRVEFSLKRSSPIQTNSDRLLLSQSILFLMRSYPLFLSHPQLLNCRTELVHNHCLTLRHLCEYNWNISLSKLLCPWDIEHVFAAERCLLQVVQKVIPSPLLSHKDCSEMYHNSVFSPSLPYLRCLHRRIPQDKVVVFNQLLQFYYAIFSLYGCYPTDELVPILCEIPDRLVLSAFISAYPFLFLDHRQLVL